MIWGDDVDRALRPVLGVTLVGTAAGSTLWSFMAIWAVEELGAKRELPYAFLVGALLSGVSGFIGGYLSDRMGRRRLILLGERVMVGLMGLPYLLLVVSHALWVIVVVVVVFVIGEMLWVPTSQAVVAEMAPRDIRGAYMGAFGSAPAIGFALAPLIGLQARNSFGDDVTWAMFACIGVVAAVLGGLALAGVHRRVRRGHSAVLEA
jgi:MFS family permease